MENKDAVRFSRQERLLEYSRDIILLLNREGAIVEANLAAEQAYGYTQEELRTMTVFQLRTLDSQNLVHHDMQKAYERDILFETYHQRKDGSVFLVEVSFRRVELNGKIYLLSIVRDITERRNTEILLRENQACNQLVNDIALALLDEKSTEEVLQTLCIGMVKVFDLQLTWIAMKEEEGAVSVRSFAGPASGYIDNLVMRWDDTPEGQGPTGRSIRQASTQVTKIRTAPNFIWRDMAAQYQMASVLVIPLLWRDSVIGALGLYSREEEFFSPERIAQMERFAGQVSIILSAAEQRRQLKLQTAALESAANGLMILDGEGIIQWVNPAFIRLTGCEEKEVLQANVFMVMNTLDSTMNQALYQCAYHGLEWSGEIASRRKDGSLYQAEVSLAPVRNEKGVITNVIAVMQDISRRKFMEAKIAESLEYYTRLLEEFPALIWRAGTDGKFNYFNKKWLAFTGRTLEQEMGDGWAEGVHPEDLAFCVDNYLAHFRRREAFQMEYRLKYYTGEYRWLTDIGIPFYDLEGEFAGYLGSCYDITENRQVQQEKLEAVQRAERAERLASLGTMAAGITHEINQPLHSIKVTVDGILYWHKRGKASDLDKIMESLEKVSNYAMRIDNIIKHMRAIIKGNYNTGKGQCNWNSAVYSALEIVDGQLASHGVKLQLRLMEDVPNVYGDVCHLEEVIINLLVNAMQALDRSSQKDKEIIVSTYEKTNGVVLEVADNGPGIVPELRDKIFEPFFTTKETGEGMGLGLSIVHAIVSSHRGKIEVEEPSQGGILFRVTLPLVGK